MIDFLQPWTTGKKVAHCIKCTFAPKPISTIHPTQYADQFLDFFADKFTGMQCITHSMPHTSFRDVRHTHARVRARINPTSCISSLQASHQIGFMLTPSSSHLSPFFYLFFRFFVYLQTFKTHNTPRTSTGEAQEYEPPARSVPQLPAQAHRYIDATSAGGGSVSRRQWDDNVVYIVEL